MSKLSEQQIAQIYVDALSKKIGEPIPIREFHTAFAKAIIAKEPDCHCLY